MTSPPRFTGRISAGVALGACLLTLASAAAQATPPQMTVAEQIALGRRLIERNCGMCHAVGPTGGSANPQAVPFRHLNQRMVVDDLGEGLATGILTGHPAMPEFRFEPYEIVSIVRYLRSVQARKRAQAPVRAAAAG